MGPDFRIGLSKDNKGLSIDKYYIYYIDIHRLYIICVVEFEQSLKLAYREHTRRPPREQGLQGAARRSRLQQPYQYTMVLILDGNSEIGAHLWKCSMLFYLFKAFDRERSQA